MLSANHPVRLRAAALMLAATLGADALATPLVYAPVNPAFGGNPMNGQVLLGTAQATNRHKDASAPGSPLSRTPLQQFSDMLERAVLGQLSSAATASVMGNDGKLKPGSVETGNFRIDIVDAGGGVLVITTTDKVTGGSTSFQIGGQGE